MENVVSYRACAKDGQVKAFVSCRQCDTVSKVGNSVANVCTVAVGYLTVTAAADKSASEGKLVHQERYTGSCKRTFYVGENVDRQLMDEYMDKYDCSLHLNDTDRAYLERQYNFLYDNNMLSAPIDLDTIYDDSFLIEAFGTADVH